VPVAARETTGSIGGWTTMHDPGSNCFTAAVFRGGTSIWLLSTEWGRFSMGFNNKRWSDLTEGPHKLAVQFDKDGAWNVDADGDLRAAEDPGLIIRMNTAANAKGENFLGDFAISREMTVSTEAGRLEHFRLTGSLSAITDFLRCVTTLKRAPLAAKSP
jgi:hypothetical protein